MIDMKHKLYRLFLLAVSAAAIFVSCGEKTVPVTALEINPDHLDLLLGSSAALTATVKPANATEQTVTWSSTAPGTVSVDNNGTVSARQAGQATINATCDGKSASCIVKVIVPTESVALDKTEITLKKGDSAILTASVNPSEATDKVVSWTSSAPDVVSVDENGGLKALRQGKATVTASCAGKYAFCQVTVRDSASGDHEGTGHENWD